VDSKDEGTNVSEVKQRDLGPRPEYLYAMAENNLGWRSAIGEFCDNSFDAGANHIDIVFEGTKQSRKLTIRDDGVGCGDLSTMVRIGHHTRRKETRLGRYGIGAKDAFLWIGGVESHVRISSVHNGVVYSLTVDWKRMIDAGEWDPGEDAYTHRKAEDGERGTTVCIISRSMRQVPGGKDWAKLVEDIGYTYAPAIKSGKQITVRPPWVRDSSQPITRHELPPLEPGYIDTKIDVGGKTARVIIGVVKAGAQNRRPGITYTYDFRVIVPASGYGCGGHAFSRVAGIVDLGPEWVLTKNKDNISRHSEELFDAVFRVAEPILKRAETTGREIESAELLREANALLNSGILGRPDAKAKRGDGDERGTKNPTGRGGKHKRAKRDQDGKTYAKNISGKLRIDFADADEGVTGVFFPPATVNLNPRHPFVRAVRDANNVMALVSLAVPIVAAESLCGRQLPLRGFKEVKNGTDRETFDYVLGAVLGDVSLDGQRLAIVSDCAAE
jgi:hypothetical protein